MTAPQRIQRSRQRGWRMPEGAIYVGRPSTWGNEYRVVKVPGGFQVVRDGVHVSRAVPYSLFETQRDAATAAVALYARAMADSSNPQYHRLTGRDLVCWCPLDMPCHADFLLSCANVGAS